MSFSAAHRVSQSLKFPIISIFELKIVYFASFKFCKYLNGIFSAPIIERKEIRRRQKWKEERKERRKEGRRGGEGGNRR